MADTIDRSLQMLAVALEKEEKGRDFYKGAVSKCANELGKDIFRKLMAEEGIHIKRVKDIYAALKGGKPWTDEWKAAGVADEKLQDLFRERMIKLGPKVKSSPGDIEALQIGLEMEQGAISFYLDHLEKTTDRLEREFVHQMVAEERTHYAALADVKQYLESPDSWFIEKEHHGLDGA